jgi:hypothetical protein
LATRLATFCIFRLPPAHDSFRLPDVCDLDCRLPVMPRRFPPPWTVEEAQFSQV